MRLRSERIDLKIAFRSWTSVILFKMLGDASSCGEEKNYDEDGTVDADDQKEHLINLGIPKLEPCYFSTSGFNESLLDDDEEIRSPIPFTTPYKIRDPIVLLERCDKIWDTLKLIKNIQNTKSTENLNASLPETNNKLAYIKYQPIFGNDNASLPNFKLSVKSTKKIHTCTLCARQYSEVRSLRSHLERIHSFILPKRPRKSTGRSDERSTDKGKESDAIEKKKDSIEEIHAKRDENKLLTQTSLPSIVTLNYNEPIQNCQSPSMKKNILTHNSNNINTEETVTNEQESSTLNDEFDQNEDSNTEYMKCVLCKNIYITDMRNHLIVYHKIESSDFMLKELRKKSLNDESLEKDEINPELNLQRQEKRKSDTLDTDSRKKPKVDCDSTVQKQSTRENGTRICNICLKTYAVSSIHKHLRTHRARGETKENFHMLNFNHLKTPLNLKQKSTASSGDISSKNTYNDKDDVRNSSNFFQNKEVEEQNIDNENINEYRSIREKNGKYKAACTCGRTFRNPYTYFIHKKNCDLQNYDVQQSTARNSLSDACQKTLRSSCDRDSGIGISITIKKKNNSYEVVGNDTSYENKSKDSKDSDAASDTSEDYSSIELRDRLPGIVELSKYSDSHSILKIQSVDEDVEVDIEESSQSNFSNNNNTDQLIEQQKQTLNLTQNTSCEDLNVNCEKTLIKQRREWNDSMTKNEHNVCVCGSKFYTRKALDIHFDVHHRSSQLICGYCKEDFSNVNTWYEHKCSVKEGKSYTGLKMELQCHYCNVTVNTFKKFDEHTKMKHFDSVVPYQCFQCEKRFPNTASRKQHFDADHDISVCSICERKCNNTAKVRHEAYHYGLGFPCHLCKKTYDSKCSLGRHRAKVHPKTAYGILSTTCVFCDTCFPSKRAFGLHRKRGLCKKAPKSVAKSSIELES